MTAYQQEEMNELETRAVTWPERARAMVITDAATYSAAAEALTGIKDLRREINEHHDPIIESAHRTHKLALAAKKKVSEPLEAAERIIKVSLVAYDEAEQRRAREEAERRLAEARRLEEEQRLADALDAEQAGDDELAEQIIAEPIIVAAPHVAAEVPKVAGVSFRETWVGECTDIAELICHIAGVRTLAHPEHIWFVQPNDKTISQQAKATRDRMKVPGIRFYARRDVAARGQR
jgi:hypothetical protein